MSNFPVIVYSGGNNARLGNMLPLFVRLRAFVERQGRQLVFPFAERVIGQLFDIKSVTRPDEDSYYTTQVILSRIVRSAEENAERKEGVGPYQYTPDVLHEFSYDPLCLRVLFGRGNIDWKSFALEFGKYGDKTLLLKEPYPFIHDDIPFETYFQKASEFLQPGSTLREMNQKLETVRRINPKRMRICVHFRRDDFRRWNNGRFFYDDDLTCRIVERLLVRLKKELPDFELFVFSDEDLTQVLGGFPGIQFGGQSMPEDFAQMAASDLVLSNGSTFSKLAANTGEYFMNNATRYYSLGTKDQALDILEIVQISPEQR